MKDNKVFCILPWVHTHVNTEGDVFPCCISWSPSRKARIGWLKDSSLEELFNNDFMKQLRLDMLNGVKRDDVCKDCYDREDGGFKSARQGYNKDYANTQEIKDIIDSTNKTGFVEPKIKSWDVRYSNLCNLKCRSCGSLFSSLWASEEKSFENVKIEAYNANGDDPLEEQYMHVKQIYFAGGEPLIMPQHFKSLKKLIDTGRANEVRLIYNSNLTKLNYNNNDLLSLWKNFKKVVIGASIDAIGLRAEYIRHGVAWEVIEKNIVELIKFKNQSKNFDFYYSPTVGVLNVFHITDMHKYLFQQGLMTNIDAISFNLLLNPKYYDCRILPKDVKNIIQDKILLHIEWLQDNNANQNNINQFENLKEYLNKEVDNESLLTFFKKTIELDLKRNENFKNTFPEYKEFYLELEKKYDSQIKEYIQKTAITN